jgi:hypothetical protein
MNLVQQIALALAEELRRCYPLDEIQATPSFSNFAGPLNPQSVRESSSAEYNLVAIRGTNALFTITVDESKVSVSIHGDQPSYQKFDNIEGLPGIAMNILYSRDSRVTTFILADPDCISKVLSVINSAYPQESKDANTKMDGVV